MIWSKKRDASFLLLASSFISHSFYGMVHTTQFVPRASNTLSTSAKFASFLILVWGSFNPHSSMGREAPRCPPGYLGASRRHPNHTSVRWFKWLTVQSGMEPKVDLRIFYSQPTIETNLDAVWGHGFISLGARVCCYGGQHYTVLHGVAHGS